MNLVRLSLFLDGAFQIWCVRLAGIEQNTPGAPKEECVSTVYHKESGRSALSSREHIMIDKEQRMR